MFKNFWGSQEQQAQPHPQGMVTNSWCPPSVVGSSTASRPMTPTYRPNSSSNVSPAEAASIIATLKDKSVDELRRLLSDNDAYQNLLPLLEPVKTQNRVRDELRNETLQLASKSLFTLLSTSRQSTLSTDIEQINDLYCRRKPGKRIMHSGAKKSELASAQEKLHELERKKDDTLKYYSPSSLLHRLQEAINKSDEESDTLHRQLLDGELDITAFVQKHKKMRHIYHKRALTNLAMITSLTTN